jgi:hypothetical protein
MHFMKVLLVAHFLQVNFYMPWLLPAARICQVPEPAAVEEEDSESHFQRSRAWPHLYMSLTWA